MHELSVTQSVLEIVLAHAERAGARRILVIDLVIGELASILDDSVKYYWEIIAKGTPAEGASLRFTRLPLELRCTECGRIFSPDADSFGCPACNSFRVRVHQGEELRVDSIEVE
ncbi:MAG: hydrogenase maturation nickel metallochaperone HypA [Chloroflexi bacterium]|nr:hydrogenase maturation nickel metallochaperone HypA [Chloroflexota bacterium]